MVNCMKTTVEIPDAVLEAARRKAAEEKTTVTALIEEGLRRVVDERGAKPGFHLKKASFGGRGLQAGVTDAGWERLRELAYKGRGA